jgi:hypothetical protein
VTQGPDGHLYGITVPTDTRPARVLRIAPVERLGLRYPDPQTRPPSDLVLDQVWIDGAARAVLRFTNLVVNLGEGPLEVRQSGSGTRVLQRIYADDGSYLEREAGDVVQHWSHGHYHFERFNRFELWTREAYEAHLDGGSDAEPRWVEDKVSMCLMDLVPYAELPWTPEWGRYGDECAGGEQGISAGWGDLYIYGIREQWVVLGEFLGDGEYVLRSIVDPERILHESPAGADAARDGIEANSGAVSFTITDGRLTVTDETSGGAGLPDLE